MRSKSGKLVYYLFKLIFSKCPILKDQRLGTKEVLVICEIVIIRLSIFELISLR